MDKEEILKQARENLTDEHWEALNKILKDNNGIPSPMKALSGMFDKDREPNQRIVFGLAFLMHAFFNQESEPDGKLHRYEVAMLCGGVIEDHGFHYECHQIIEAHSEKEAEEIYNKRNNCSYYYGKVLRQID